MLVGRIGRPHGVRGEVTIEVRTDDPDARFAPGAALLTDPADRGPLVVAGCRRHRETLLVAFDGVASREGAEALRDTQLMVAVEDLPALDDPDAFYDHQLVGLRVQLTDGSLVGRVAAVRHDGADLLVVERDNADEALIPFVAAMVPTVDVAGGYVVVDPPEGLLEL